MTVSWRAYRRARRRSRQAWALLAIAGVFLVAGITWFFTSGQFLAVEPQISGPSAVPVFSPAWMKPVVPPRPVPSGSAAAALESLPVKGRAPKNDYDRSAFGQAWFDADRNG
ncbi:MAG: endonuclease, partial [Arthrobacter sp.]|nr:endonuclease [Arthrobacter sp.]